ncbi:TetR/AcrR family transcriptional regulator [Stenotrophomonas sp. LGBM10]|uniref:TetR/AcrR family transcriptional regulator n=1 Tax=Stenotrophomonas sp. LGBM10 TaxID=3390038 RepID=UPI00398AD7A3
MFEAAMQLLEAGDLASLTTNAVAARAGVSIGTLYQYFDDKQALLDALVARELGQMSASVLDSLAGPAPADTGERIRGVVGAVIGAYGGRSRVHRLLIEHAMSHAVPNRLSPLYGRLIALLTAGEVTRAGADALTLTPAQAFVLTYAMAGVLRAYAVDDAQMPREDIEDALVALITGFLDALRPRATTPLRHSGRRDGKRRR